MTTAPPSKHDTTPARILFKALARREKPWQLGCTTGSGHTPREQAGATRRQARVLQEIAQATRRVALSNSAPLVSCGGLMRGQQGRRIVDAVLHCVVL